MIKLGAAWEMLLEKRAGAQRIRRLIKAFEKAPTSKKTELASSIRRANAKTGRSMQKRGPDTGFFVEPSGVGQKTRVYDHVASATNAGRRGSLEKSFQTKEMVRSFGNRPVGRYLSKGA